jgi:hypothetical protein
MVYTDIHVKNIQICNIETREEASRVKEIFTIGRSKLKERKYLKIDLLEDNKREYLLFEGKTLQRNSHFRKKRVILTKCYPITIL